MKKVRAVLLLGSALLFCLCHLPILIALLASSAGGTALAAVLHQHVGLIDAFSMAYFVFALWLGRRMLIRPAVRSASGGGHPDARPVGCCTSPPLSSSTLITAARSSG